MTSTSDVSRKLKVIHLLGPLRPSGFERMLQSAGRYWDQHAIEPVVVGQGDAHPFAQELQNAGYEIRSIPAIRSVAGLNSWWSLLRQEAPDVVHIHTEGAFSGAVLSARAATPRARIVRTIHNYFFSSGWWGVKRRIQCRMSDRFVDSFICLTPEMANHERGFGRDPAVIGNWVGDEYFDPRTRHAGPHTAALVGNCSKVKNHEVAIEAVLHKGWQLAHLGNETGASPQELQLLSAAENRGALLERGVHEPRAWLNQSTVFLMPSMREGFPVALAEAIASGLPCVIADSPGLEWAASYPLVMMVPSDATSQQWAQAIERVVNETVSAGFTQLVATQREMARTRLSARKGVSNYVSIYRGDRE